MTKQYFPLHCHSDFSLLDGLAKPSQIAKRCKELGLAGTALTDHGTIAGSLSFGQTMSKKDLKPILGVEFYVAHEEPAKKSNRKLSHMGVLSKNYAGWKQLIRLTSAANHPDNFYYRPRLDTDGIGEFTDGNLIGFSGHLGSCIANTILGPLDGDPGRNIRRACDRALLLQDMFGRGNFYLEKQLVDTQHNPTAKILAEVIDEVSIKTGIPRIATPDSHYAFKDDAIDQRVLICTAMDTTFGQVRNKMVANEDVGLAAFFKSNNYHIPSYDEMIGYGHTEEELENTLRLAEMCESYDLTSAPCLPQYDCPDGMTSSQYLHKLCQDGWHQRLDKIKRVIKHNQQYSLTTYGDRVRSELAILDEAKLADYFLIVRDIVHYAINDGQLVGCGRGSAAGSLVLYLLGVTHIDPIEHDLLFSRFYNAGRNTKDRVSLPDVDMDFEIGKRGEIIQYIRNKFGHDKVAQMLTFSRMQGRSAFKDVCRVRSACDAATMNKITEHIPDEAEIADQLQDMRELDKKQGGDGEASILRWALDNHARELKQWAFIAEDGSIQGEFGPIFEQAIRLEGTKRSQGKHAAGVVISPTPLAETCPMVYDKNTQEMIAGMEMNDLEAMGMVKFDCLGIAMLDKMHGIVNLLYNGELR
jgi:DNA polymerase-3 subunit alpha